MNVNTKPFDKEHLAFQEAARAELATVCGLDFEAGLARFEGNRERYRHWLKDFVATSEYIPRAIRNDVVAGQMNRAAQTAHGFKEHVGMLGMMLLHSKASALELALRENLAASESLLALERSISEIRDGLKLMLDIEVTKDRKETAVIETNCA